MKRACYIILLSIMLFGLTSCGKKESTNNFNDPIGADLPISPTGSIYHVDAINGNDQTGEGTATNPYKTLSKVLPLLHGGEQVLLYNGSYDDITFDHAKNQPAAAFSDWITFKAAPGKNPIVSKVYLHGDYLGLESWNGSFEMHVNLVGLTITDGIVISNVNQVRVTNCIINRIGPLDGSNENLNKQGVLIRRARSVTIENCEITKVGTGIVVRGNDILIQKNQIHDNTHDGINLTGCERVSIDGNQIYNLDDGIDDNVSNWGAHVDGIQIYMESDGKPVDANRFITIRSNRIYHVEAMVLMLQNRDDIYNAHDWVIENNIFGGSAGFMIHGKFACKNFIFRNNSIVYVENDQFNSRGRVVKCDNYSTALPAYSSSSNVQIYNNIFCASGCRYNWIASEYTARFDHNLYYLKNETTLNGNSPVLSTETPFANPTKFDGVLTPNSLAINAGATNGYTETDLYGTKRKSPPEIGAYEQP